MLDCLPLKVPERHYLLALGVKRRKLGSLVSQNFYGILLRMSQPACIPYHGPCGSWDGNSGGLFFLVSLVCVDIEADFYFHTVSRWDRILIFGACNLGALACFVLVFALWPIMMAKPKKFAIL